MDSSKKCRIKRDNFSSDFVVFFGRKHPRILRAIWCHLVVDSFREFVKHGKIEKATNKKNNEDSTKKNVSLPTNCVFFGGFCQLKKDEPL